MPIRSVSVARPSLDDVFLSYTGTTIRDAEASAGRQHARVRGEAHVSGARAPGHAACASRRPACAATLRAVKVVWQRELIRFGQDRIRIVAALVQPVLFLFVLGTGLQSLTKASTGGISLQDVHVPRRARDERALHRDVLGDLDRLGSRVRVPARDARGARAARLDPVGKCLGGATVATIQGLLVLVLAPLVDISYDPVMLVKLIAIMFLLAFSLTAFGLVIAAQIQQIQTVMGVMQVLLLPLAFLSGSLYPISRLPTWMAIVVRLNPITYAVHLARDSVFDTLDASPVSKHALNPSLTWFGWAVPDLLSAAIVLVIGVGLLGVAIAEFARVE